MVKQRTLWLRGTRLLRAIIESAAVASVVWCTCWALSGRAAHWQLHMVYILLAGLAGTCWCALRAKLLNGPWWRPWLFNAVIAGTLGLVQLLLLCLFQQSGSQLVDFAADTFATKQLLMIFMLSTLANFVTFPFIRLALRVWFLWDQLRRTQLQWALTHAQVMVVALGAGLLTVFILALEVLFSGSAKRSFDPALIIPTLFVMIVMGVVAMLAIVPPSALFSYIAIRRTVRRLKVLAAATSALRHGDYSVRVPVSGEDEVAQLQADFNTMAADLERTMGELQRERDTVASLLQDRRTLIANVSHELRTPVAIMRTYLETSLTHWNERSPAEIRHDLVVMEDEAKRLQTQVEELFTLARADVGQLALRCEPTDIRPLVTQLVEAAKPLAWDASKIAVVADLPPTVPPITVDGQRLAQALHNLLHNALRHTPPGGIVALVVAQEPGTLLIHVKDTGEGIDPADLPHIWKRFYQTASTRQRQGGGTGIGLALVKEWTEAMGGTVAVESVRGEGTCFTLRFRTAPCQPSHGPQSTSASVTRPAHC